MFFLREEGFVELDLVSYIVLAGFIILFNALWELKGKGEVNKILTLTQVEYYTLPTKDANTIYMITG